MAPPLDARAARADAGPHRPTALGGVVRPHLDPVQAFGVSPKAGRGLDDRGGPVEPADPEEGDAGQLAGKLCDPVICMAEGKVLAEGTVDEVKNDERVIEAYLGRGLKNKLKEEAAHG